jgi:hypothetical protein
MHKLSRTSLAAIVCPSAPFLAPRLLRATVPTALNKIQCASSPGLQKACYATKPPKGKKPGKLSFRPVKSGKGGRLSAVENEVRMFHFVAKRC